MNCKELKKWELNKIIETYPYVIDFFSAMALPLMRTGLSLERYLTELDSELLEDLGLDQEELINRFDSFLIYMEELQKGSSLLVHSIKIIGGRNKYGVPEKVTMTLKPGEIICVVGPTGSGKSRLLADIEWLAQKDTPTGRMILINDQVPPTQWRFSLEHKLVAQLSQNMNFVVDMKVYDFIKMHAESRMVNNPEEITLKILKQANYLAGERFSEQTPVTSLSGGQSRALMIADTALLSTSPIVLIDEIENAGIDRKKALELLVREDKIVLMATHDPILALIGQKRIVLQNGGIKEIIESSPLEKANLQELERFDRILLDLRNRIRSGERLELDLHSLFEFKG